MLQNTETTETNGETFIQNPFAPFPIVIRDWRTESPAQRELSETAHLETLGFHHTH
jgi:hypothetical protein